MTCYVTLKGEFKNQKFNCFFCSVSLVEEEIRASVKNAGKNMTLFMYNP
jgi:hypothetical protein